MQAEFIRAALLLDGKRRILNPVCQAMDRMAELGKTEKEIKGWADIVLEGPLASIISIITATEDKDPTGEELVAISKDVIGFIRKRLESL